MRPVILFRLQADRGAGLFNAVKACAAVHAEVLLQHLLLCTVRLDHHHGIQQKNVPHKLFLAALSPEAEADAAGKCQQVHQHKTQRRPGGKIHRCAQEQLQNGLQLFCCFAGARCAHFHKVRIKLVHSAGQRRFGVVLPRRPA